MANATERRLRILQLLPRRKEGKITVPRLIDLLREDGLHAEKRTVQRDMEELSRSYPINCDESVKPYKWFWASREALAIPAMGQFTALTFHLAEKLLKPLLPAQSLGHLNPSFAAARRVLKETPRQRTRRWLDKIRIVPRTMRHIGAPIAESIYQTVTQALYDDKQLEITYVAASSETAEPKTYAVHPYALLHRDVTAELVGRIEGDDTIRRWMLHRIRKARIRETRSNIPANFNLDSYLERALAYPLSGQEITLKAWIKDDGQAFNHVLETRLSEEQGIEYTEDGLILTASVRETIELKWWILGMGDRIEVLKPQSLREEIRRSITAAYKHYENEKTRNIRV